MQEVLVDVGEHACGSLERVIGGLEAGIIGTVLVCGMTGQDGRDVEDNRCFLVCERVLGSGFVCEGIIPMGWSARSAHVFLSSYTYITDIDIHPSIYSLYNAYHVNDILM